MADDNEPANAGGEETSESSRVTRLAERRARPRTERIAPITETVQARTDKVRMLLGPKCPYEPIGYDGELAWVVQASGHIGGYAARGLSRTMMVFICADARWLGERYPRTRAGKAVKGFAADEAVNDLIAACQLMGFWSPEKQLRGVGAWRGDDGDLILHRGSHLIVRNKVLPLGRHGEYIYRPSAPLPMLPNRGRGDGIDSAGREILSALDTFTWGRGTFDSSLMLGMIGCGLVGGALPFRPHCWITGEYDAGKSTLQNYLLCLFTPEGMCSVTDASAAGLWQQVGRRYSSCPIGLDELEAREDPAKPGGVIAFARQATTGGTVLRGGANHEAASFAIQSCFFCSSIIRPPMPSQDLSRFLTFNLTKEPPGVRRPFSVDSAQRLGAALTRRLSERWDFLMKEVYPGLRQDMLLRGLPNRMADLFGIVLAVAGVAEHDTVEAMQFGRMLENPHMQRLIVAAREEQTPEFRRCFDFLLTSKPDRQKPATIGDLLERATRPMLDPGKHLMQGILFDAEGDQVIEGDDDDQRATRARDQLLAVGLRVGIYRLNGDTQVVVMVANQHRALAEIFERTHWRTLPEAAGGGGWTQVMRRAPGVSTWPRPVWYRGGYMSRALAVPLSIIVQPHDSAPTEQTADEIETLERRGDTSLH